MKAHHNQFAAIKYQFAENLAEPFAKIISGWISEQRMFCSNKKDNVYSTEETN